MSSLLTLLVLVSTLILVVDCQSKPCRYPYKQSPIIPNYLNGTIKVTHISASPDVVGIVTLSVSKELSTIPKIVNVEILPGNLSPPYTTVLSVSLNEWYLYNGDQVYLCDDNPCASLPEPVNKYFNFPSNEFTVLGSTLKKDTIVLIVESTVDGNVTSATFGLDKTSGMYQLQSQTAVHKNFDISPSGITVIDDKYERFALFFGTYWTTISSNQLNQLDLLDLSQGNQLRLSRTWVGCPVELCFEGDLDAAVNVTVKLTVFRGQYSWPLDIKNKGLGMRQDITDSRTFYMDAAFTYSNRFNFIVNNQLVSGNIDFTKGQELSVTDFPISAAFVMQSKVVLLSGTSYMIYDVIAMKLNQTETGLSDTLWPGLPDDIDAAVEVNDQTEVLFFKGSYHFKANINGGPVVPTLTMNTLYQCADSFYADYTSDINMRTFTEFQTYMKKFEPSSLNAGTTTDNQLESTSSSPSSPSTRTIEQSTSSPLASTSAKSRTGLNIAIVAIVVLVVIGLIVTVVLIRRRNGKRNNNEDNFEFTVAASEIQTIDSISTTEPIELSSNSSGSKRSKQSSFSK